MPEAQPVVLWTPRCLISRRGGGRAIRRTTRSCRQRIQESRLVLQVRNRLTRAVSNDIRIGRQVIDRLDDWIDKCRQQAAR